MTSWRDGLPPALPSMWRLLKLGYRHEPWLLVAAFGLSQIAALPDALLALWLKLLGEGLLQDDRGRVLVAAVGLGLSATATWFLRTASTRVQRRFRDKVTVALESHVARLQASLATIAHQERPDYLDRLPRQGGARDRDRPAPGQPAARGLGALVRAGVRRALGERGLAHPGLGDL